MQVDVEDKVGDSPLICAARTGSAEAVHALAAAGADLGHCNNDVGGDNAVRCHMHDAPQHLPVGAMPLQANCALHVGEAGADVGWGTAAMVLMPCMDAALELGLQFFLRFTPIMAQKGRSRRWTLPNTLCAAALHARGCRARRHSTLQSAAPRAGRTSWRL
jgi:hypothetical protein